MWVVIKDWLFNPSAKYDRPICAACGGPAPRPNRLGPAHQPHMVGKIYCSNECWKLHYDPKIPFPPDPSSREREFLNSLEEKYADCESDRDWRRESGGFSEKQIMEYAKVQVRKIREQEKAEMAASVNAKVEADTKARNDADQQAYSKWSDEYREKEKRKQEQLMRDQERKKEREERERQKQTEKEQALLRKQQEADAIKQAEDAKWKPKDFKL